jgi:uncharacterized membrane protein YbjE (DUF340 family)
MMGIFAAVMLTEKEKEFINWWELHGQHQKKSIRQWITASPMAIGTSVSIILLVVISRQFGWFRRANTNLNSEASSVVLIIILALIGFILFSSYFTSKHRRDINEQYYRELIARRDAEGKSLNTKQQ